MLLDSPTNADQPGRIQKLGFADEKRIPTVQDFKALLQVLRAELSASGQLADYETTVVDQDGQTSTRSVDAFRGLCRGG